MTTKNSAIRVDLKAVLEFKQLLNALQDISLSNRNILEEHFKLLEADGIEKIEVSKYPILSAIVYFTVKQAANKVGKRYIIKTNIYAVQYVKAIISMPLPIKYQKQMQQTKKNSKKHLKSQTTSTKETTFN